MSVTLSNEKKELIKKIAQSENFKNYQLKVTSGSTKGDGYLGIISTVKIQDEDSAKELNLILKSAMTADTFRENTPVRKAYEREIFLYEKVFSEFRQLANERGITNKFAETAKSFGSSLSEKEECLVLENLREIGFRLWDRMIPMDEDHVGLVFQTYGKFHGSGLALKLLKPETFEDMQKNLTNIFVQEGKDVENKKRFMVTIKRVFKNGYEAVADNKEATQRLAKFEEVCNEFFFDYVSKVDKFSTILHGDCWCNNMMFKYEKLDDPARPTKMCLLDFQLSKVGSPVLDLSHFLYSCTSKEVLKQLPKFLKIYHDNLSKTLSEAGLDPEQVCTLEELEAQWKFYSRYGLYMALFLMKVFLSDVNEAPDLSKMAESGNNFMESINNAKITNMEETNKRLSDVIVFMIEHDFL